MAQQHQRRLSDLTEEGLEPTCDTAWKLAANTAARLEELERRVTAIEIAFLKNDIGMVDFDGHRVSHLKMKEATKVMNGYKQGVTKQIISAVAVFLIGLITAGIVAKFGGKL